MRRGIRNNLSVRVNDMNLTQCTNLKLYVSQNGETYEFTGTADLTDTEVMHVTIPKATAVSLQKGKAQVQVALTDANNIPRSHNPIVVQVGDFLKEEGYGS